MNMNSLKKAASGAIGKAKSAIKSTVNKGKAIVKKAEKKLTSAINGAKANVKKCVQTVKTNVNKIENKAKQIGKTAQKNLISAVNGAKSSKKTVIQNQTKPINKNIQNQTKPTNKNIGNLQKSLIAATGTTVYNNAVIPTGKKQTNGAINVANLPVYNRAGNYIEGQKVKVKGLDGKWYVGTAKAEGYIGTGGARQSKFVPDNTGVYSKGNSIENCRSYKYGQQWKDFAKGTWDSMSARSEKMLNSPNDFMNYLTMGVWNNNAENGRKMLKTKNAYDITNWATMGGADMVNGAINPEKPLSPEHWMNSLGVVSTVLGVKGIQNKYTHNDIIDIKKPYKKAVSYDKIKGDSGAKGMAKADNIPGRGYHKEVYANKPVKVTDAVDKWDEFLGPGEYTDIHPRTGLKDPDRIFSADGKRSIRFGSHEMNSKPSKFHYHEEIWTYDQVNNVMNVDNTVVRVPYKN